MKCVLLGTGCEWVRGMGLGLPTGMNSGSVARVPLLGLR